MGRRGGLVFSAVVSWQKIQGSGPMFSLCLRGIALDTLNSCHSPKTVPQSHCDPKKAPLGKAFNPHLLKNVMQCKSLWIKE